MDRPLTGLSAAFEGEGYVVVPGLVGSSLVSTVRQAVDCELKPFRGRVYRQTSGVPEINHIDAHGFVMNPVLNLQSIRTNGLGKLRAAAEAIFTSAGLQSAIAKIMGSPPVLVQSMLFEGNTATPAHQDGDYLDAADGKMVAVWIALEDIHDGAGRFYVHPGSHAGAPVGQPVSPSLKAGDVLFWHASMVHGSLPTTAPTHSRLSVTAHFIPLGSSLRQFARRSLAVKPDHLRIHRPKDQDRRINRLLMAAEAMSPVRRLKQAALSLLLASISSAKMAPFPAQSKTAPSGGPGLSR